MKKLYFLLFLAFIEGASVMACELLGAKMIAPFFGSSLYVWASVLGITLFGLMTGYYTGGYLSEKIKKETLVYWILLLAGVFLAIMPYTSVWVMTKNLEMDIRWGSTLSLLVFMFPPLVLMGMTSPVIINMINTKLDETGRRAGSVYAISTLGGIVATFLVGFYMLPEFGIKWPCFIFGFLLMIFPLLALIKAKLYSPVLVLLPFFFVFTANVSKGTQQGKGITMLYEAEGLYGQIRVFDLPFLTTTRGWKNGRVLVVNNTVQSQLNRDNLEYNLWDWSVIFPTAASIYPKGSDLLLMGLGGGMLFNQFKRLGFNIDVVELDERIKDAAINYFAIPAETPIVVDDARHVINTSTKTYDVIVLDLFFNETPPAQVPTIESFTKLKTMLNEGGMVLMNFYGYTTGTKGRAARSVIKTFETAGFTVTLLPTPGPENGRNLIMCATLGEPDWSKIKYSEPELYEITPQEIHKFILDKNTLDMSDAVVLTDKQPQLEKMYIEAATEWRRNQNAFWLSRLLDAELKLVK
jgi:predicted membrane-bound spermidine synthase